jgi:hypothetical protein
MLFYRIGLKPNASSHKHWVKTQRFNIGRAYGTCGILGKTNAVGMTDVVEM